MAADTDQAKTEAPTPRRREEARNKGQIARSGDLSTGLLLLSGTLFLWQWGGMVGKSLLRILNTGLQTVHRPQLAELEATQLLNTLFFDVAQICGPLVLVVMAASLFVGVLQAGFHISTQVLAPDWERLSPVKGLTNLFSQRAAMRGLMAILKLVGITAAIYWMLKDKLPGFAASGRATLPLATYLAWNTAITVAISVSLGLLAIGLVDYLFQRVRHEEELKMTRQEVRDEMRREQGDPQIKARLRKLRRELVQRRSLQDVPQATVVLTNPTHLAVALKYDRASMAAPVVVAKGADVIAQRIIAAAREHGVPVLERKPLARALYSSVEVGQEIPETLYRAIAEILAYVLKLRLAA